MNENWPRWIFASSSKHFNDVITTAGLVFRVEGEAGPEAHSEYCEFRLIGPTYNEQLRRHFKLEITIDILVNMIKNEHDFHRMPRLLGIVSTAFAKCINVYKYGTGPADDQSKLGGLILVPTAGRDVEIIDFGQTTPDLRVVQGTVQGQYRMFLDS